MAEYPTNKADLQFIFIIGPPGAGKGTACKRLVREHSKFVHLSVGDHLRRLRDGKLPAEAYAGVAQDEIRSKLKARENIDAKDIMAIVGYQLEELRIDEPRVVLIDGFPRTKHSAAAFEKQYGKPMKIIQFICRQDWAQPRFLDRNREEDDGKDVFDKRYKAWTENHAMINDKYLELVEEINAEDSRDKTYERLLECLKTILAQDTRT